MSSPAQAFPALQNDLLLQVLAGHPTPRPPVWMMRQAGRYLPEYRVLQEKYPFFTRVQTPDLVSEITLQPIERLGVDAAIIFSDILVVLQALGVEVEMHPGRGPVIPAPLHRVEDAMKFEVPDVADRLHYVFEALTQTRHALGGKVPLIGFAGSPWTLFCYLVQGQGSKDFNLAKAFCWAHPEAAHHVLHVLSVTTQHYLQHQVAAGAQALQVFDSWGGLLGREDFETWSLPYLQEIVQAVEGAPLVLFAKGAWHSLEALQRTGASALGLDWTIPPSYARQVLPTGTVLQGNLDPARLLSPPNVLETEVQTMIRMFGKTHYIANLGHGILPQVPPAHAQVFVDTVKGCADWL